MKYLGRTPQYFPHLTLYKGGLNIEFGTEFKTTENEAKKLLTHNLPNQIFYEEVKEKPAPRPVRTYKTEE